MPVNNNVELIQYLPPDIVAKVSKELTADLTTAAQDPNLSLKQLFDVFLKREINFRDQVIPVGEAETAKLAGLVEELEGQIKDATQQFGVLAAANTDTNQLLTARGAFQAQIAKLKTQSATTIAAGAKTQEVVFALRSDQKSARVIGDKLGGLEKKGVDFPAIVARALLQSLFEPEEPEIPMQTVGAMGSQDFITASRQAVVESGSRRAELPPAADNVEMVIRVSRQPRRATALKPSGKLGVKNILASAGIDTSDLLTPIDLAHITKALPRATKKLFGVEPTPENMAETLLTIVKQEAGPNEFGGAISLRKLHDLGAVPLNPPNRLSPTPPQTSTMEIHGHSTPAAIFSETHLKAKTTVEKPLYVMKPDDPMNQVFHFKKDRWAVKRWGDLTALVMGSPKKIDPHSSGSRKALRHDQRDGIRLKLGEEIDIFVVACKRAGITTCQQVLDRKEKFRLTPEFERVLSQLGETPLTALESLPGLIDLRPTSPIKPSTRIELLDKLRRRPS